ncbi:MAG: 3-methyl-2-oxobutanoate hydroxymethyltransferase [Candidatus Cloacimonas sp. 4484_140]|nr:MAG: 3-methyl-2-oxobutanoate hydroxymethyltransferase [Candidatus Cloacimonas sp. 4484_140]
MIISSNSRSKISRVDNIRRLKHKEKIVMLTCYDFQMAKIFSSVGIDLILVGDSLGMVFQGDSATKNVTMKQMLYHVHAVSKGAGNLPIVGDMPIHSYENKDIALENAQRFIEAGADAIKLEGYFPDTISYLVEHSIPVQGHIGLLPQTYSSFKVVGRKAEDQERLLAEAKDIEQAGAFTMVLESIPEMLGKEITESIEIPTIGIGAGRFCDGQVLVINDLLGMDPAFHPKFVKRYANLFETIYQSVSAFKQDVKNKTYPDKEHVYE